MLTVRMSRGRDAGGYVIYLIMLRLQLRGVTRLSLGPHGNLAPGRPEVSRRNYMAQT